MKDNVKGHIMYRSSKQAIKNVLNKKKTTSYKAYNKDKHVHQYISNQSQNINLQ